MKQKIILVLLLVFFISMLGCQKRDIPAETLAAEDDIYATDSSADIPVIETPTVDSDNSNTSNLVGAWVALIDDYAFYFSFSENNTLHIASYKINSAVGCTYFKYSYTADKNAIILSHSSTSETRAFEYTQQGDSLYLINTDNIIFPSEASLFTRIKSETITSTFAGSYEQCGPRTSENSGGYFSDFDFWHERSTYGTYIRYFNFYQDGTYSFDLYNVFDDTTHCAATYHGYYQFIHDGSALSFDNKAVYNFIDLDNGMFILIDNNNILHLYAAL